MKSGTEEYILHLFVACFSLFFSSFSFSQNYEITDSSYFIRRDDDFNLIMSADKGHTGNVQLLLRRGADINAVTFEGVTPLMYATQNADLKMVRMLADSGADINKVPLSGATALIVSAQQNFYEIAEYLVRKGANLNLRDKSGVTAVHYAAAFNHYDIMDMLVFYGADIELADSKGNTPLITASFNNCLESADLLIQNGANINVVDNNGFTSLMVSILQENTDIAYLLLENGAEINLVNNGGMSALAFAVTTANLALTKQLVEVKADINHRIKSTGSLLDLALKERNADIATYLESIGVRRSLKPGFDMINLGPVLDFNCTDFMNGFNIGFLDFKYQAVISMGFVFRPVANRILADFSNVTYQFWERRYFFYIGLEKRFKIIDTQNKFQSGPYLGVKEIITSGGYRGSALRPDTRLITSPSAGWFFNKGRFSIMADYHYQNFKTYNINKNRFSLSLSVNMSRTKKRMINKRIDWLN